MSKDKKTKTKTNNFLIIIAQLIKGASKMQTITLKDKITKENEAHNQLQDLGFHTVGNLGVAYIDFFGQWLAFKNWSEALNFINTL